MGLYVNIGKVVKTNIALKGTEPRIICQNAKIKKSYAKESGESWQGEGSHDSGLGPEYRLGVAVS